MLLQGLWLLRLSFRLMVLRGKQGGGEGALPMTETCLLPCPPRALHVPTGLQSSLTCHAPPPALSRNLVTIPEAAFLLLELTSFSSWSFPLLPSADSPAAACPFSPSSTHGECH